MQFDLTYVHKKLWEWTSTFSRDGEAQEVAEIEPSPLYYPNSEAVKQSTKING